VSRAMQQYQRAWTTLEQTAAAVAPSAWERPSPCPGWTARQLVGHLVDGHHQVQALLGGPDRLPRPATSPTWLPSRAPTRRPRCAAPPPRCGRPWRGWTRR